MIIFDEMLEAEQRRMRRKASEEESLRCYQLTMRSEVARAQLMADLREHQEAYELAIAEDARQKAQERLEQVSAEAVTVSALESSPASSVSSL